MREIHGDAKNLHSLLNGMKFYIDYYQREYRWKKKQVTELIDDLYENFANSYEPNHEPDAVEDYGHYFLGSIIISNKDGRKFIIDGQQRLTTLTLLLIYIYRLLNDDDQKIQVANLIFSAKHRRRSFNLDVKERKACMEALFSGKAIEDAEHPESVINILNRYQDITELFPEELRGETLPYFADWLIENVYLVEITAYSDTDAYTIFETMNDRGLSLTSTEMLKGYLLANIEDPERRASANQLWKKQVSALNKIGKDEESDAIKAWLRSQYAKNIRERKRAAKPLDFDRIGTEFHRWVRENRRDFCLTSSSDYIRFIEGDFAFFTHWYARLREAANTLAEGLESVRYCADHNFTLQYPVLLAPLKREDVEKVILQKFRIVSAFLDILISRRIWNWRAISYSTMQYAMFIVMREIRGKDTSSLVKILQKRLEGDSETFVTNDRFQLHGTNRWKIHLLLARMTDFVETQSRRPSRYQEYVQGRGQNRYEIEHIWADHPERHSEEFGHPADFAEYRNRIGGLLLLPKSFNASYGDLPYKEKRKHYLKHNLLAQSLHEQAYERDPGFADFRRVSGLPFKAHSEFNKIDLDARQELYLRLAEQVWSPERLLHEAES